MASDSYTFTVGKLDAGMAILLGERAHLIEFPSILLPAGATAGSIVNIAVHQNHDEEKRRDDEFWDLQAQILAQYGKETPAPPKLMLRNVTQTSVTLEWPHIQLATAQLRSLDIYRDNQRLASIPSPHTNTSTKLSGLKVEQEYTFQLVLRTTAGTYPSNLIRVRTHSMSDTSGISVCFGTVQDPGFLDDAKAALGEMKAKWSDKIQIDTTHFVCTHPSATPESVGSAATQPGVEYQRAMQLSIPIVQPHWILACHNAKTMVPIANYYLGSTPPTPNTVGVKPQRGSLSSPPNSARVPSTPVHQPQPTTPTLNKLPPATTDFVNSQTPVSTSAESTQEQQSTVMVEEAPATRKRRSGTMNKEFKFPPSSPSSESVPPPPPLPSEQKKTTAPVVPAQEVPPPPPIEKNDSSISASRGSAGDDNDGEKVSEEGMDEIEL